MAGPQLKGLAAGRQVELSSRLILGLCFKLPLKRLILGFSRLLDLIDELPEGRFLLLGYVADFSHQGFEHVFRSQVLDAELLQLVGAGRGGLLDLTL